MSTAAVLSAAEVRAVAEAIFIFMAGRVVPAAFASKTFGAAVVAAASSVASIFSVLGSGSTARGLEQVVLQTGLGRA